MQEVTIDLDWAWDAMHNAFFNEARFVTIRSCRRSFKTAGACRWIIEELLDNPNSKGIWVDTINKNIDRYYERYFKPIVGEVAEWNYQKKTLQFINGSYLDFGSAESPENMEGFEYDFGFLNEAGIILKKDSLWDNTLRPMFKYAKKVRIVGTPKGKNKFHKMCNIQDSDWSHHHYRIDQCPFYTKEEIEKLKKETPQEVFKQEYLAEFLDGAGSVFRNITQCFTLRQESQPQAGRRYVMSVDLAKHVDFTVIYTADLDSKEVVYTDRFNQIDWGFQKKRIIDTYRRWNCVKMIVDSTGIGDVIYDDLYNANCIVEPFKFTQQSKNQIVQNLSLSLDNQAIRFFAFPELVSELEIFGYEVTSMGNIRYNAPEGYHDDCVMSLAMINILLATTYTPQFYI